jgi:predicted dehydrogenase
VLVEKPIAENTWQADELLAAAAGTQTVLQVGHSERFNPAWTVARQEIESPTWINAVRCGPYSFRSTEVGVVLDLMIHDIDLVLDLVQSPPEQIEATGGVVFGPHEDWAQASIRFADGCWATFVASRVEVEGRRRMQIRSSQTCADLDFGAGAARFVTRRPAANHFRPDEVAIADRADWKERLFSDLLEIDEREPSSWNAILDEQRDFVDAIKRGEAPRVSGRQGRDALAVAERIIDQITNGRGGLRRAG